MAMGKSKQKVLVIGIGNVLLRDEGIGVHIVRTMEKLRLPKNIALLDGGVSGIDLLQQIEEADRVVVIDAIDAGDHPGSIFCFKGEEAGVMLDRDKTSLHQVDLFETLKIAKFLDCCPETVIIGVQPKDVAWGMELTPDLTSRIPQIIDLVIREVRALEVSANFEGSERRWI